MILVADSGSTKCDWILADHNGTRENYQTIGFNPVYVSADEIAQAINSNPLAARNNEVTAVYFYGAGCSSIEFKTIVANGIKQVFTQAEVHVSHDLDGAAYATCEGKPGISCILGTGSNACHFDGKTVSQARPSLGYILGDEGSGAYFGKILVTKFLYKQLPDDIHQLFSNKYSIGKAQIIDSVYRKPRPNTFLASFMDFFGENKSHPFVQETIAKGMNHFLETHVTCLKDYQTIPCHFIGSVAFYFQDILKQETDKLGIKMGNVIQKPIDGLVEYHLSASAS